jgi:hypothetical protein
MKSHNLKEKLNSVGWFIPPYVSSGFLDLVASRIAQAQGNFTQDDLEKALSFVYDAERLASMILYRYRCMPVIKQFAETISESVAAHFFGLGHVAVGGLIPVIEGAGRLLAMERKIKSRGSIKNVFEALASYARKDVMVRRIGAVDEIVDMLDSFLCFVQGYFFIGDQDYPLGDGTNRPGIVHGRYTDSKYGKRINFYKTIAAVDFLTFISSLNTKAASGFAPDRTPESSRLAAHYASLRAKNTP